MFRKLAETEGKATMEDIDRDDFVPDDFSHEKMVEFLEQSREELHEWSRKRDREEGLADRKGDYYPLSDYSRIWKMPNNVHPSYITEGLRCLQEIIDNEAATREALTKRYENNQNKTSFLGHFENNVKEAPKLIAKLKKIQEKQKQAA